MTELSKSFSMRYNNELNKKFRMSYYFTNTVRQFIDFYRHWFLNHSAVPRQR